MAVNEVDVAAELDSEFTVTHEVFYVDGMDNAGFGRFVGGIGVTIGDGRMLQGWVRGGSRGRLAAFIGVFGGHVAGVLFRVCMGSF